MLVLTIENRGLVVNHESQVGQMLERTGTDIGASKRIYERAELVEFCSATLSRQVMEADPRLLAFCPFGIGIYTLPDEAGKVHLVYRRPRLEGDGNAAQALSRSISSCTISCTRRGSEAEGWFTGWAAASCAGRA